MIFSGSIGGLFWKVMRVDPFLGCRPQLGDKLCSVFQPRNAACELNDRVDSVNVVVRTHPPAGVQLNGVLRAEVGPFVEIISFGAEIPPRLSVCLSSEAALKSPVFGAQFLEYSPERINSIFGRVKLSVEFEPNPPAVQRMLGLIQLRMKLQRGWVGSSQ